MPGQQKRIEQFGTRAHASLNYDIVRGIPMAHHKNCRRAAIQNLLRLVRDVLVPSSFTNLRCLQEHAN